MPSADMLRFSRYRLAGGRGRAGVPSAKGAVSLSTVTTLPDGDIRLTRNELDDALRESLNGFLVLLEETDDGQRDPDGGLRRRRRTHPGRHHHAVAQVPGPLLRRHVRNWRGASARRYGRRAVPAMPSPPPCSLPLAPSEPVIKNGRERPVQPPAAEPVEWADSPRLSEPGVAIDAGVAPIRPRPVRARRLRAMKPAAQPRVRLEVQRRAG